MDFEYSARTRALLERLNAFMDAHVYPNEKRFAEEVAQGDRWQPTEIMESAQDEGARRGPVEPLPAAIRSRRGPHQPRIRAAVRGDGPRALVAGGLQLLAPDTGNMETLERYASPEQKKQWLEPLLEGRIRSCFTMTEPAVASSDATNIQSSIVRDGGDYVGQGRKWWSSGAMDPRCRRLHLHGPDQSREPEPPSTQSMILIPRDAAGIRVLRRCRCSATTTRPMVTPRSCSRTCVSPPRTCCWAKGRGFEIAQGPPGPGPHPPLHAHHRARRARRSPTCASAPLSRVAFGKPIAEQTVTLERIAEARIKIDQARLLVLHAAWRMDTVGNKVAAKEIAMIKVAAPIMACEVIDWAIQAHGAAGLSDDFTLATTTPTRVRCASRTVPTRCTATRSASCELRSHPMNVNVTASKTGPNPSIIKSASPRAPSEPEAQRLELTEESVRDPTRARSSSRSTTSRSTRRCAAG
jgi:acyl-CoA dehydrogenase